VAAYRRGADSQAFGQHGRRCGPIGQ
jgi:hypothetical protein